MANKEIPAEIEYALDALLGYLQDTEYEDYRERVEMGESVQDHVYVLARRLADHFFPVN